MVGRGRRARRRQVAPRLGVDPFAPERAAGSSSRADRSPTARPRLYLPVIDLLKAYFQIEARDDRRRIREKVTGKLVTLDQALQPTLPAFLALLDVPGRGRGLAGARSAAAAAAARSTPSSACCCARARCSRCCWSSRTSTGSTRRPRRCSTPGGEPADRADAAARELPAGVQARLGQQDLLHAASSRSAAAESADELLARCSGRSTLEPLQVACSIPRTEGNPFFLEESVRALVETGALAGERGRYRLVLAASIRVPATVQAVLAARIDRLSPEEKRLLQGAVIGKDVPFTAPGASPTPGANSGEPGPAAGRRVPLRGLFPELEYTFKHALTHDVAYAGLTSDRRRALDTAIVGVLEQLSGRASRRTRGALGAPRLQGRELVQSGHLPSAGGRQSLDAVRVSSSGRPFRAGAARPRASAGRARHARAVRRHQDQRPRRPAWPSVELEEAPSSTCATRCRRRSGCRTRSRHCARASAESPTSCAYSGAQ